MKRVLVVDGEGRLAAAVRDRLGPYLAQVELHAVASGDDAFAELAERCADVVVAGLREPCAEPLSLALQAMASRARLGRVLLVGPVPPELRLRQLAGGRIRFCGSLSEAGLPQTVMGQDATSAPGRPEAFPHLEVLDLVRLAGLGRFSGAVRVRSEAGDGLLGFLDGRLTSASARDLEGSDAFYQMILWRGGPAEELDGDDIAIPAPNLDGDVDTLLEEAARFRETVFFLDQEDQPLEEGSVQEGAGGAEDREAFAAVWSGLTRARASGVQVVLACPGRCEQQCCQRLATRLAQELDAPVPSARTPTGGPMFVRLHPAAGGQLTLTFVPCTDRNAFLFEALCRSADAVMLCCGERADVERWTGRVPEGVPVEASSGDDPETWCMGSLLRRLAEAAP